MIVSEMFSRLEKAYPISVALRASAERIFSPEKLNNWFDQHAEKQYIKKLMFSTLFEMMSMVVFKVFPSINAAYQDQAELAAASLSATYKKINGFEPSLALALVRDRSEEMAEIVDALDARRTPLLPGYNVKMLDGNCIATLT